MPSRATALVGLHFEPRSIQKCSQMHRLRYTWSCDVRQKRAPTGEGHSLHEPRPLTSIVRPTAVVRARAVAGPVGRATDRRFGRGVDSTSTRPPLTVDTFHAAHLHIPSRACHTTHTCSAQQPYTQHEAHVARRTQKSTRHVPLTLSLTGGLSI